MPHSEYCNRRVQGALDTVDFQVREYILREKDKEIALYKENRQLYQQLCHAYQQRQEFEGRLRGRGAMRRNWTMNQNQQVSEVNCFSCGHPAFRVGPPP